MINLTFILTNKCNIACRFCAPGCSPKLSDHLSSEQMKNIFDEISKEYTVPLVIFTGGEPMLYQTDICDMMLYVKEKSKSTKIRIVTNGYWAKTKHQAKKIIRKLKACGLTEINFSVDDFHQEFISIETIKFATTAALDCCLPTLLVRKTYPGSVACKNYYEKMLNRKITPLHSLKAEDFHNGKYLAISEVCTLPLGRGSDIINKSSWLPSKYFPKYKNNDKIYKGPCSEVLKSCNISADGYLLPCCGLVDRSLRTFHFQNILGGKVLDTLEQCSQTTLYNWLALEGPWAIKEFIKSKDKTIEFAEEYVQACQICQEVFSNKTALKIIDDNLDVIGIRLAPLRCAFDANRSVIVDQAVLQIKKQPSTLISA